MWFSIIQRDHSAFGQPALSWLHAAELKQSIAIHPGYLLTRAAQNEEDSTWAGGARLARNALWNIVFAWCKDCIDGWTIETLQEGLPGERVLCLTQFQRWLISLSLSKAHQLLSWNASIWLQLCQRCFNEAGCCRICLQLPAAGSLSLKSAPLGLSRSFRGRVPEKGCFSLPAAECLYQQPSLCLNISLKAPWASVPDCVSTGGLGIETSFTCLACSLKTTQRCAILLAYILTPLRTCIQAGLKSIQQHHFHGQCSSTACLTIARSCSQGLTKRFWGLKFQVRLPR